MSTDQAMLVWLDGRGSKKGSPNENYARELMELFSLGIGNYTEKDVREAARAFTGWEVGTEATFTPADHDAGEKTVLGKKGRGSPTTSSASASNSPPARGSCAPSCSASSSATRVPATKELLEPLAVAYREVEL